MKVPAQLGRTTSRLSLPIHLPRRTVRLRLTLVYIGLFVVSGAGLLAINLAALGFSQTSVSRAAVAAPASNGAEASGAGQPSIQPQPDQSTTGSGVEINRAGAVIAAAIALGTMTVVSIALSWIVAGRVLRPLRTMTATTRQISEHSLHERLAMQGPSDELKELGDTIDGLLGRLEGSFNAQRRFVANASHELRTPHAMIRTSVDVATAKPGPLPPQVTVLADKVREGLDRADRLLEGLLTLARAQHGALPDQATVSLRQLVSAALEERGDAIAGMDIEVDRVLREARVDGSETLLTRMVENVVDNAVRHNERGGWIHVETGMDGSAASLVVETGGPMLDESKVRELAQPFRRLGADRTGSENGTGLGLSIVAAIAAAHGGALHLQARPQGGLRVHIVLPAVGASGAGVPA
jgi:signal transduction histidine kinase